MTTNVVNKTEVRVPLVIWIVLAVVGLGGLGIAWGLQLAQGMSITGISQQVVWGLYIAGFFTAMGAGAALLVFAAISEFSALFPIARRNTSLFLALVNFVIGGLLITMDIGNPINLWRILTAGRFSSMMTWDFFVLIITGILTLVYLIFSWEQTTSTLITRILGILGMVCAVALVVVEGWMLAVLSAHPLWNGGLTVISFLVVALVAGLAVAMLAWPEIAPKLSNWLMVGLWVMLAFVLVEILTGAIAVEVRPHPEVSLLVAGVASPMFWVYLIIGTLAPLVILFWQKNLLWMRIAAALALLGVLLEKLWLLTAGQAIPWLALPQGSYVPTWVEWLGLVGAIALAALLYLGVGKLVRMKEV
ncbi:MAG: NrfD/PsrC family molybdoenzyme membrane anchor subunit [Anaerolineales bacterium]|jgi:molybdopterin-containing oxidoreductase family membrane subunit